MEQTSSYEIVREQERKQRAADVERLKEIVEELGYRPECKEDGWGVARVQAKRDDDVLVLFANECTHRGMLSVTGSYPRDGAGECYPPRTKSPEINVSLKKSDEQIVKDIRRRFLPTYVVCLRGVRAANKERDEARSRRVRTIRELGGVLGIEPSISGSCSRTYPSLSRYEFGKGVGQLRVETKYGGDDVKFELELSKAVALRFARWLVEQCRGGAG